MTPELFARILQYETAHNGIIKQSDIEQKFNINRSTFHRWKKKCVNGQVPASLLHSGSDEDLINGTAVAVGADSGDSDMDGYDDNISTNAHTQTQSMYIPENNGPGDVGKSRTYVSQDFIQ